RPITLTSKGKELKMQSRRLTRLFRRVRKHGFGDTLALGFFRHFGWLINSIFRPISTKKISDIVCSRDTRQPIIIMKSPLDYHFPYAQRPHHLARSLANQGALVFFVPRGAGYDRVMSIAEVSPNLYITPHLAALLQLCANAALFVFSTDMSFTPDQLRIARKRGFIIYVYIEAID